MSEKRNRKVGNILIILTLVCFALIISRMSFLYVKEGVVDPFYRDPKVESEYYRGSIWDRNGNILAMDSVCYMIEVDLRGLTGLARVASLIEPYTNEDALTIELLLENSGEDIVRIKSNMGREKTGEFAQLCEEEYLSSHISVRRETERVYPLGLQGSSTIGRVENGNGVSGVEKMFNEELLPPLTYGEKIVKGKDITLSINSEIQYLTYINTLNERNAGRKCFSLVIDRRNGEILGFTHSGEITESMVRDASGSALNGGKLSILPSDPLTSVSESRDYSYYGNGLFNEISYRDGLVLITASPYKEKAARMMAELSRMSESRGLISPRV